MELGAPFLTLPVELEAWLLLGYVVTVLVGARVFEALARVHFGRARRSAEQGFAYDAEEDQYQCPEGERLALHLVEPEGKLAVYRAPAARCNGCPRKASCTPHEEGRHLYRSLAAWAETDIGQFHRRLSLLMFGVAAALSVIALLRWWLRPGTGLLLVALAASLTSVAREVRGMWPGRRPAIDPGIGNFQVEEACRDVE